MASHADRSGTVSNEATRWGYVAHRRLQLAAGDRLSPSGQPRLARVLRTDDPTNEISAGRAVTTAAPAAPAPTTPGSGWFRFGDAMLAVDLPEATRPVPDMEDR